jgi:nicotinamide-nucleotide amidase
MKYLVETKSFQGCERTVVPIIHKTILTYGRESLISERIEDWENSLPGFFETGLFTEPGKSSFASFGENEQRIIRNALKNMWFFEPDY